MNNLGVCSKESIPGVSEDDIKSAIDTTGAIATCSFMLNKDQVSNTNSVTFGRVVSFTTATLEEIECFTLNANGGTINLGIYDGVTELLLASGTLTNPGFSGFRRATLDTPVEVIKSNSYWLAIGAPNSGPTYAGLNNVNALHVSRQLQSTTTLPASVPVNQANSMQWLAAYSLG